MKKIAAGIVASALLTWMSSAQAATYTVDFTDQSDMQTLGTPLQVGDTVVITGDVTTGGNGTIDHAVKFTTATAATLSAPISSNDTPPDYLVNNLIRSFLDDGGGLLVGPESVGSPLTLTSMAGTGYQLFIAGVIDGTVGGRYNASITVGSGATVVPLPGAILLFGPAMLGLGYLGRRHRRQAI